MGLHRLAKFAMIASLLLAAAAWWMKDALPPPEALGEELHEAPRQSRVERPAIDASVNGVKYSIQPRHRYDLYGLVVSLHHSDSWWDLAHREWGDHINLMDLCVVWGENARSGAYRRISFDNTQWECHWNSRSQEAWAAFDQYQVANNHMVTDKPEVARALKKVHIGDQIRARGYLVDYTIFKAGAPAGKRVSSEVRSDSGPGACEVLYLESFEVLDSAGRAWRTVFKVALGLLAASVLLWIALPVRFED